MNFMNRIITCTRTRKVQKKVHVFEEYRIENICRLREFHKGYLTVILRYNKYHIKNNPNGIINQI